MSEQVQVPGVGGVKRQWLYAGGALTVGIVGYAWWRHRGTAAAAPAPVDPNAVPATDYTNPETYTGGNSTGNFDTTGGQVISTNDQWTQHALQLLTDSGYEAQFVLATLGKWLSRQPLSASEIDLVRAAKAVAGDPPVGGPYPIIPATGPGASTSAPGTLTGLHVTTTTPSSISLAWDATSGADSYTIDEQSARGSSHQTTTSSSFTKTGLMADLDHTFTVTPTNSSGSGPSASVTGHTQPAASGPAPGPAPAPAPSYDTVVVTRYTSHNAPWNSTMWGIGQHYHRDWHSIWGDSANAGLRARRGAPDKIQPGDHVLVRR